MSTDTVKGRQIMTEALRASVDAILNKSVTAEAPVPIMATRMPARSTSCGHRAV